MDLSKQILEVVGFDILFLGFLTLLAACMAMEFLFPKTDKTFIKGSREQLLQIFGQQTADRPDGQAGANPPVAPNPWPTRLLEAFKTQNIVILALAALLGMVINLSADEILDSPELAKSVGIWKAEDQLKEKVLHDATFLHTSPEYYAILDSHWQEHDSKAFFQHVYASFVKSGEQAQKAVVNSEFLVMKTLRVLFLDAFLLFLAAMVGAAQNFKERRTLYHRWIAAALLFPFFSWGFVRLWQEQGTRYYKKLLHAYVVCCIAGDKILISSSQIPSYPDLRKIPGQAAYGKFLEDEDQNGETSGFELSAVVDVDGHVIVADNETVKIRRPDAGCPQDTFPQALFEVKPREKAGLQLCRVWNEAFQKLVKKDYDDIEAMAVRGNILYLVGSHSLNRNKEIRTQRQVLLRMEIPKDGTPSTPRIVPDLMMRLLELHKELGLEVDVPERNGKEVIRDLNIEGATWLPGTDDLLLGLRGPVVLRIDAGEKPKYLAVVLRLHNVDRIFEKQSARGAQISIFALLDLAGRGIASLEYDSLARNYLIAAAPRDESGRDPAEYSALWKWEWPERRGQRLTELMRFPGHKLEGVARLSKESPWGERVALTFDEEELKVGKKTGEIVRRQFGRMIVMELNP